MRYREAEYVTTAIKLLFYMLTPEQQQALLKELDPIQIPRAGDLLQHIKNLIPRQGEFTVADLREQITIPATNKEIYNAIGYLTRRRHIRSLGYGRYTRQLG